MIFSCVFGNVYPLPELTLKKGTRYINDQGSNENVLYTGVLPFPMRAMNGDGTAFEQAAKFANDGLLIRRARLDFLGAPGLRPGMCMRGQMSSVSIYVNGKGEVSPSNPREEVYIELPRFFEWVDINLHLQARAKPWNVEGARMNAYYDMLGIQDDFIGRKVKPVLLLDLQGTWIR